MKLDVDFEFFREIDVYVRGYRRVKIQRRRWQSLFRQEEIELPEFHRLVLAFRPNQSEQAVAASLFEDRIYLKNFKDIPETDLEILLPGAKVRLSIVDRGKILVPTLSGIAVTIYKIVRAAAVLTLATLAGIWGWVVLVGALSAYIVKSVLGFVRTKDKYRFDLTQNLYMKNLDNNAGVLFRVFKESEEQEISETLIGYAMLLDSEPDGLPSDELAARAEEFLQRVVGEPIHFQPLDALAKLARLGLASVDQHGIWTATELADCSAVLIQKWHDLIDIMPAASSNIK